MPISLPDNPANGQTVQIGTIIYTYDATVGVWNSNSAVGPTLSPATVTTSDTAPSNPSNGDMWFDSSVGKTFIWYDDGTSTQWIQMNPNTQSGPAGADGSSVTVYANLAAFPSTGNTEGDFAFAQDTKSLYVWDGTEWDRISSGPQIGPRYTTTPASTLSLNTDGSTSILTAVAVDESGFPITYDWDAYSGSTVYSASSLPPQLTAVSESSGVFTLTPSTSDSDAGTVTFRTKASDGVLFTPAITTLTLTFGESIVVPQDTTRGIAATGTDEYSFHSTWITSTSGGASSNLLDFHPLGTTFYFEIELLGNSGVSDGFIGIGNDGGAYGYNSTDQVSLYLYGNGAGKYPGNTSTGFGVLSAGDKVGFKVTDGTSGPVVTMYLNGTADTAGSYTLPSGGSGRVKIWLGSGSSGGATHSGKFLSKASSNGRVQYLPTGAVEY